jgi:hypothetical protein
MFLAAVSLTVAITSIRETAVRRVRAAPAAPDRSAEMTRQP